LNTSSFDAGVFVCFDMSTNMVSIALLFLVWCACLFGAHSFSRTDDERQNLAVVQLVLQLPFTADITFTSQPKPLAAGEKPVHSDMHGHRLSELVRKQGHW
jgi:hypothetical protein